MLAVVAVDKDCKEQKVVPVPPSIPVVAIVSKEKFSSYQIANYVRVCPAPTYFYIYYDPVTSEEERNLVARQTSYTNQTIVYESVRSVSESDLARLKATCTEVLDYRRDNVQSLKDATSVYRQQWPGLVTTVPVSDKRQGQDQEEDSDDEEQ